MAPSFTQLNCFIAFQTTTSRFGGSQEADFDIPPYFEYIKTDMSAGALRMTSKSPGYCRDVLCPLGIAQPSYWLISGATNLYGTLVFWMSFSVHADMSRSIEIKRDDGRVPWSPQLYISLTKLCLKQAWMLQWKAWTLTNSNSEFQFVLIYSF